MNRTIKVFAILLFSAAFTGCQLAGLLGIQTDEEIAAQEQADLLLLTAAYLATQSDDASGRFCQVTSSAGSTTTTVNEQVFTVGSGATNIFTGDDVRSQSAVYFALDNAQAGDVYTIVNFGNNAGGGQGEGTIAFYSQACPLDTTTTTAFSSGSEYTDNEATYDGSPNNTNRTLTINTSGSYLVQFYTGTGTNSSNGANATITKN